MKATRRSLLGAIAGAGSLGVTGLVSHLSQPAHAAGEDYRALVVLFLMGGNDGHNLIVPTDGMYTDYQAARTNLALSRASLANLPGTAAGHSFGLHPALAPMVPMYGQGRLAFIANAGPLVVPTTALQAKTSAVDLPPFLLSHSDQIAIQQGWTVTGDITGWAGRGLELLPSTMRHPINAVTTSRERILVLGKRSRVSFMPSDGLRFWGVADLARPETTATQTINRMAHWQSTNLYEAEYARTFGGAVDDSTRFTQALMQAREPGADFGSGDLAVQLRALAKVMPVLKSQGYRRQVFLVSWGSFDHHVNQRGSDPKTQDAQFSLMAKALAAFDEANKASGLDMNVLTLMMSDFGRTVRASFGGGSEHAWGNHWFAFGGPVSGGTVLGTFPSPVLGGPDDGDLANNGRHVPTTSTDQVGATVMQWMGLDPSAFHEVFPNLANFKTKTIPLLRA